MILQAGCFGSTTQFKLIGPIGKFVFKPSTDPRWYEGQFPTIKASPEDPNLKVFTHLFIKETF